MALPRLIARIDSEAPAQRLAVLIDADNAQAAVIDGLLHEVARYGEATVKRIYGDFTSPSSASWKKVLQRHAIKPIQQFAYTTGKNATDSTLIIDAMDLLYTRKFDGFCLVTSDSDFTGLATRLREEGLQVLGFGEQKTPEAFRNACHKFIFTEVLRPAPQPPVVKSAPIAAHPAPAAATAPAAAPVAAPVPAPLASDELTALLGLAMELSADDSGWAHLGTLGSNLSKIKPEFDSRNYGFRKLSDLIRDQKGFETDERQGADAASRLLYVRARRADGCT